MLGGVVGLLHTAPPPWRLWCCCWRWHTLLTLHTRHTCNYFTLVWPSHTGPWLSPSWRGVVCRGCFITAFFPTHFPLPHLGVCLHALHGYCDTITPLYILHHQLLSLVFNFCLHNARKHCNFHLVTEKPCKILHVPVFQLLFPSNHHL